jgi:hypothetical protein
VSHVAYSKHVEVARSHLGEAAPVNTCVQDGMEAWPHELGLATLGSDSVTECEKRARAGHNGWAYHEGTAGIRPGYYADWKPSALGSSSDRHVCVVEVVDGDRWRGIGAGTPSGKVAHQPASGGTNTLGVLQGYFVPPSSTPAAAPHTVTAKPAADTAGGREHVVVKGDTVARIAAKYQVTQPALLRANPPLPSHRSANYHIARANLIVVGQRIRIP